MRANKQLGGGGLREGAFIRLDMVLVKPGLVTVQKYDVIFCKAVVHNRES